MIGITNLMPVDDRYHCFFYIYTELHIHEVSLELGFKCWVRVVNKVHLVCACSWTCKSAWPSDGATKLTHVFSADTFAESHSKNSAYKIHNCGYSFYASNILKVFLSSKKFPVPHANPILKAFYLVLLCYWQKRSVIAKCWFLTLPGLIDPKSRFIS